MNNTLLTDLMLANQVIGKKWRLPLIVCLYTGPKGFNELMYHLEGISAKILSATLQECEKSGVVKKEVLSTTPVQIEYSLTELGKELQSVLVAMSDWGEKYRIASQKKERP